MSVSFKKIFGLSKSKSQESVLADVQQFEKTEVNVTNAAVNDEVPAKAKHDGESVCCGSCSK